jgi:hypothetical protein
MKNDLSSAALKMGVDIAVYLQSWLNKCGSQALKKILVKCLKTILGLYIPYRPPTTIYNHSEILFTIYVTENKSMQLSENEKKKKLKERKTSLVCVVRINSFEFAWGIVVLR